MSCLMSSQDEPGHLPFRPLFWLSTCVNELEGHGSFSQPLVRGAGAMPEGPKHAIDKVS